MSVSSTFKLILENLEHSAHDHCKEESLCMKLGTLLYLSEFKIYRIIYIENITIGLKINETIVHTVRAQFMTRHTLERDLVGPG